jgi:cytochrome P450
MFGFFTKLIERRRTEPGDDMISALVHAKLDGADVSLAKILGFAFTMVTGGNDTVTGMLSGSSCLLTEHPDQRAQLIAAPQMIPNAVEELLRLTSRSRTPVGEPRLTDATREEGLLGYARRTATTGSSTDRGGFDVGARSTRSSR